jgi:murein L,D-transpeptidase YafK
MHATRTPPSTSRCISPIRTPTTSPDTTGGDIMIHGVRNGLGFLGPIQHMADWTDGCIAVSDGEMDEIYRLVPNNTPIDIQP